MRTQSARPTWTLSLVIASALLLSIGHAGTLTNFSWSATSNVAGAQDVTYTFSFTTATQLNYADSNSVLYAVQPLLNGWKTLDVIRTAIVVTVNGTPATVWQSFTNVGRSINIRLSSPSIVPAGSNIVIVIPHVNNADTPGTYPWQFVQTSLTNGTAIDSPVSVNPIVLVGPGPPKVTTSPIVVTSNFTATAGGVVTSDSGRTVTARGVCYNTAGSPYIADPHTTDSSGMGAFSSPLTGLTPGRTYHVRAYATNNQGTSYGEELTFVPLLYCTPPTSTNPCSSIWIAEVAAAFVAGAFSNGTGCTPTSYADYHETFVISQYQGATQILYFTCGSQAMNVFAWVDYDDNGEFDADEQVLTKRWIGPGLTDTTAFHIPSDAPLGAHRMRIRGEHTASDDPLTACAVLTHGETEDYTLEVLQGAPAAPTAIDASRQTLCPGDSTTLTAQGAVGTVHWYTGGCGSTLVFTGPTFTVSPSGTTTYFARNNDNGFDSDSCASITINVRGAFDAGTIATTGQLLCAGADPDSITSSTNASGGDGAITYRWQSSTDATFTSPTTEPGSNTPGFNPAILPGTRWFRRQAHDDSCHTAWATSTGTWKVTVLPEAQVNEPSDTVVCNDDHVSGIPFSTTNVVGTTSYTWTNSDTAIGLAWSGSGDLPFFVARNWRNAPRTATIVVTPTLTEDTTSCIGPSESFTITVNPEAQVDTLPDLTFCPGQFTNVIAFSTENTGGITSYTWTNSDTTIGLAATGGFAIPIFTATNNGSAPVTATIEVTPTFTNLGVSCPGPSTSFTITVNPQPGATISGTDTVCLGAASPAIIFTGANGVPPYTFGYTLNGAPVEYITTLVGDTVSLLLDTGTAGTTTCTLVSVADTNGCTQPQSGSATVTVREGIMGYMAGTTHVCQNADAPLIQFTGEGGTAPYTFTYSINGGTPASITTSVGDTVSVPQPTTSADEFDWSLMLVEDANGCTKDLSGMVLITVDAATDGGAAVPDQSICTGTTPSDLSIDGRVGDVVKWQWSADASFTSPTDIADTASTLTGASMGPITAPRWFRAIVKNGECGEEASVAAKVSVTSCAANGSVRYVNPQNTGMNGITVKLYAGATATGMPIGISTTNSQGGYSFGTMAPGTYTIRLESAGGGGWLTWGGVNSADYLAVQRHVGGSILLPSTPAIVRLAADVKAPTWPAGAPTINAADVSAIRSAYLSNSPAGFDVARWIFTRGNTPGVPGTLPTPANQASDFTFTVTGSPLDLNFSGLCAADVNGSYIPPSGIKKSGEQLLVTLGRDGTASLREGGRTEVAVRMRDAATVGAVTLLFMQNDALRVTAARMADGSAPDLVSRDGVTALYWSSLDALHLHAGDPVLWLTVEAGPGYDGRDTQLELADAIENEVADADGRPIVGTHMQVAALRADAPASALTVFPNPVTTTATVQFMVTTSGPVRLALHDATGREVRVVVADDRDGGVHTAALETADLPAGLYLLRMTSMDGTSVRTQRQPLMIIR